MSCCLFLWKPSMWNSFWASWEKSIVLQFLPQSHSKSDTRWGFLFVCLFVFFFMWGLPGKFFITFYHLGAASVFLWAQILSISAAACCEWRAHSSLSDPWLVLLFLLQLFAGNVTAAEFAFTFCSLVNNLQKAVKFTPWMHEVVFQVYMLLKTHGAHNGYFSGTMQ